MYFVTGASGSGKTTCFNRIMQLLPQYTFHDFDEVGVPANADRKWRQETTEL